MHLNLWLINNIFTTFIESIANIITTLLFLIILTLITTTMALTIKFLLDENDIRYFDLLLIEFIQYFNSLIRKFNFIKLYAVLEILFKISKKLITIF